MTGLLNRLAESNMQGIVRDVAVLYEEHGRRQVAEAVATQVLQVSGRFCARAPGLTQEYCHGSWIYNEPEC